jgi:hypothetical protein
MNKAEEILERLSEREGMEQKPLPVKRTIERNKHWDQMRRKLEKETPMDLSFYPHMMESKPSPKAKRILAKLTNSNHRNRILDELNQDNLDSVGPVQSGDKFLDMENDFFKKE